MPQELEFSIMAESPANIQPLLDQFEAEHRIRVRLRLLTWDIAWSDLVKVALYRDGPDVSEIGSTWLGDLVAMNALRPFAEQELAALGKPSDFLPSAWNGGRVANRPSGSHHRPRVEAVALVAPLLIRLTSQSIEFYGRAAHPVKHPEAFS